MRSWPALALGVLLTFAASAPASAAGPPGSPARAELERGYELRRQGNFVEALPHLLQSYRLDPQVKTLINLADSEEHVGKLVDARAHWREAQVDSASGKDIAEEARRRIAALDARIPTLRIRLADGAPGATIDVDGVTLSPADIGTLLPSDPGRRTVAVRLEGHESRRFEVILELGESREVLVAPGPELPASARATPTPSGDGAPSPASPPGPAGSSGALRIVAPVVAGVGVAGLAVGTVFGVTAINKKNAADCPGNVCTAPLGQPATLRDAVGAGNASTIFVVAGAVLVAGGAALWLLAPDARHSLALTAAPSVAQGGGGVLLAGAW